MVFTKDGFFAVSDGMGTNNKTPSSHETKIFSVSGPSLKLMYGVSGTGSILNRDGVEIFKPKYRSVLEDLAKKEWPNLGTYADAVMLELRIILRDAVQTDGHHLPDFNIMPKCPLSFHLQFAGYCCDVPVMTERQLDLWSNRWCVTTSESACCASLGDRSIVGAMDVVRDITQASEDSPFYDFKTTGLAKFIRKDDTLSSEEFIEGAKKCIQACMTGDAREKYPVCKSIGGDIQSAELAKDGLLKRCVIAEHKQ
jgi:hypothetical protein